MSPAQRKWLLGAVGVAALILAWFAPEDQSVPPAPSASPRTEALAVAGTPPLPAPDHLAPAPAGDGPASDGPLDRRQRSAGTEVADLFKTRSWYVPPPPPPPASPPPPPPPPPPPSAPPLPFAFFGQVNDDREVQVVLTRGDRVVTVVVGQDIDKNYRLESYENGMLTFLYIPLDIRQTLPTGVPQ